MQKLKDHSMLELRCRQICATRALPTSPTSTPTPATQKQPAARHTQAWTHPVPWLIPSPRLLQGSLGKSLWLKAVDELISAQALWGTPYWHPPLEA